MMSKTSKLLVYACLVGGAAVFILPFIWMVITALKPIDQTLSQPGSWLPRRFEARMSGGLREVRPGIVITEPSLWVRLGVAPRPALVRASSVWAGAWHPSVGAPVDVQVLKEIPASAADRWIEVSDTAGSSTEIVRLAEVTSWVSFRWENFPRAIAAMRHFWRYLANTLILCVLNVLGTVVSSAMVAYGFSRIEWRGREAFFGILLATMMIPFPVVMVPLYGLFRSLGMVGTLQPLWVGSFFANAFNVFLLRQFFRTIPKDLSEAARIDGCGEFRIFWQIILPLCAPALIVVGLFTFLGAWNDFLGPLIYLSDERDFTLALGLDAMKSSESGATEWPYLMAASTLVILPVIAIFFVAQRRFVEGIALTGIKG